LAELTAIKEVIVKKASTAEAFNKLLDFSGQFDKNAHEFMVAVVLQTDLDLYSIMAEKVSLMTMHASKGLEVSIQMFKWNNQR
jgi:superfamily I DNA/RNA helicase